MCNKSYVKISNELRILKMGVKIMEKVDLILKRYVPFIL